MTKQKYLDRYFSFITINKIYGEARDEEDKAETKAETAGEEVEDAKERVEAARMTLQKAKRKFKDANEELNVKKKWRKTVQKRALFVAAEAMKEDNSELGNVSYK